MDVGGDDWGLLRGWGLFFLAEGDDDGGDAGNDEGDSKDG